MIFFSCQASGGTEVCVITGQKSCGDKDPKLQVGPNLFRTSPAVKQAGIFFLLFLVFCMFLKVKVSSKSDKLYLLVDGV